MNVAVIGSGGREHALSHKIKESELLDNLYIIPGNPGTSILGENINLDINAWEKIALVWKSGSWKSTFVKLLMKQVSIQDWSITFNHLDIKNITKTACRTLDKPFFV